jgi:S-adenosylmethionine/arginine decarboxylase-like enzyme
MNSPHLVGQHLLVDGYLTRPLTSALISSILSGLTNHTQLTALGPPLVHHNSHGWVGFQMIAESHISLHTQAERFFLDVFSCKEFGVQGVLDYVREWGKPYHTQVLDRST